MKRILTALIVTAAFALAAPALAAGPCPDAGGTQYLVDTPLKAATIAAGYQNLACHLVVSVDVTPTVTGFVLEAKAITLAGPLAIVNSLVGGDVTLAATTGPVVLTKATVKARDKVTLTCSSPGCPVTVTDSELIAATNLLFGGPGGNLTLQSNGNLSVTGTTWWAGALIRFSSLNGTVTVLCLRAGVGCADPLVALPAIITAQCGNPIQFPCAPIFTTPADLSGVCLGVARVACGGGGIQFDLVAKGDIHIEHSLFALLGVVVISTSDGKIFAAGADLTATKLTLGAKGNGAAPPVIDLTDATLAVVDSLRIVASGCPPAPGVCIDLTGATLEGTPFTVVASSGNGVIRACAGTYTEPGPGFPSLNGIGQPPYTQNTLATAAQCAPDAAGVFD